jgi:hypothetical protein
MFRLLFELEEPWLQTRRPTEAEQRAIEELGKIRTAYGQLKVADLQFPFKQAQSHSPTLHARIPD